MWPTSPAEIGSAVCRNPARRFITAPTALHRRLTAIAGHYGVKFSDLIAGGLHLLSFAGADAVLAIPDRQGKVQPTPLFDRLLEAAADIKPRHIGIDATADTFAGNEIDRSQVRRFVGLMRKLAIVAGGSVVLLARPQPHRDQ